VRFKVTVWKRLIYDVVSPTRLLYAVAFGPRSGKAIKVLPPAQARPEPTPPSRLPAAPLSRRPAGDVERSGRAAGKLPRAISTGDAWRVGAANAHMTTAPTSSFLGISGLAQD